MIDLSIHISKLLFDNDTVIIPGLGIFEALPQKTVAQDSQLQTKQNYSGILQIV